MSDEYSDDSLDEYGRNEFYRYSNAPGTRSPNQSPIPPCQPSPRRTSYLDNISFEELNTLERPMEIAQNSPRPSGHVTKQTPTVETYYNNYEEVFDKQEAESSYSKPAATYSQQPKSILKQDSYYTQHDVDASQNEEYYAEKQKQYEREYAILLEKEKFQAASLQTHKTVRENAASKPSKAEPARLNIDKPKSSPPKRPKAQNSPIKRSKSLNKPRSYAEQYSTYSSPRKDETSNSNNQTSGNNPLSIFKPVRKTRTGQPKQPQSLNQDEFIPQFHQTMNTSREDLGQYRKPSVHTMKKLVESFSRTSFDDSFGPESNQDQSFNYYQEMNNSGYSDNQDFYHPPEKHISQAALRTINRPTMDLAQDPPKSKSLDSYLEIQKAANKSPAYKKYTIKEYKSLQQQQGLYRARGLGPEKAPTQDTLRYERRKNFAEAVRYMNKGKIKPQVEEKVDIKKLELERKREIRKKQLEYAKSIPPPPKPPKHRSLKADHPISGSQSGRSAPPTSTTNLHGPSSADDENLDALLSRHKTEQARVTRLRALVNIN